MKNTLCVFVIMMICCFVEAQMINYVKYRSEIKYSTMKLAPEGVMAEFEMKANKEYGYFHTHNILKSMNLREHIWRMFDFKNGAVIDTAWVEGTKRYTLNNIDSEYQGVLELEEQTETPSQTISGHKCYAFKVKNEKKRGAFVPLSNYTIWIDKDAKVNPKISTLLFAYMLVDGFGQCKTNGLVVRIDFEQKKYNGSYTLVNSDYNNMENSEVILPWHDESFIPSVRCMSVVVNKSQTKATYLELFDKKYEESGEQYIERTRKLFYKVTGKHIGLFQALRGNKNN